MTFIICPQCGKQASDALDNCFYCGFSLKNHLKQQTSEGKKLDAITSKQIENSHGIYTICPKCKNKNANGIFVCNYCGYKYKLNDVRTYSSSYQKNIKTEFQPHQPNTEHNNIDSKPSRKPCPKCGGSNYHAFVSETYIPAKTKTRYTVNLNPFQPFTLVNKKEKTKRPSETIQKSKFLCDDCGCIFRENIFGTFIRE
ncbi:MAG: hypothetical protein ACLRZ9_05935 [Eubacterium sp.]